MLKQFSAFDFQVLHRLVYFAVAAFVLSTVGGRAATIDFRTPVGTLLVEADDPTVKVSLDGRDLKITGAGPEEIRLHLEPSIFDANSPTDLLTVTNNGLIVVRVRAGSAKAPGESVQPPENSMRDQLLHDVRQLAGQLVSLRNKLDERVWNDVQSRWTTTEAAKLLIAFFRGDGTLPGFRGTQDEARELQQGLAELRQTRELAMGLLMEVAGIDAQQPASPLCGTWEVTDVRGAGGVAADALELYDPDPVGRKLVVANDAAALVTGAGFWLFDTRYDGPHGIDLSVVVRGDTVYRGRFQVEGHEATLRVSPMNSPRPRESDGEPSDGGFVLHLRRTD